MFVNQDTAREDTLRQVEVEVTDQEMAERYSNLVGTINKKFSKKVKQKSLVLFKDLTNSILLNLLCYYSL